MKTKGKSILSKLMVVLLAIGITAGCCPAFSVAEADDETVASAALSAFKTEASMLYNKRADGEKLQIDGSKAVSYTHLTRITRIGPRRGDAAEMCVIELL